MGSLSKQVVLVRAADTRACVCMGMYVCVHVPRSLKNLDGPIACCLLELFFKKNVDCFMGMNVCVICWDEIFIMRYNLQACMCWEWEGCLNTSHQYHFSALPLTGISVPSEEITV